MAQHPRILFQYQLTVTQIGSQTVPHTTNGPVSAVDSTTGLIAYTVPTGKQVVSSTVAVCNRSSSAQPVWIAAIPAADLTSFTWNDKYYVFHGSGTIVPAGETLMLSIGMSLEPGAQVRFFTPSALVAMHGFGVEDDYS